MIGLISDTHGMLRDQAIAALEGCEQIIHAGDVGKPEILQRLRSIAPVVAVRGNIDSGPWADALPETTTAQIAGIRIFILHDLKQLALDPAALGYDLVVSGHSHQPREISRGGVRYVNPGSAGPRRFKLPITLARLHTDGRPFRVEFVTVG